MSTDMEKGQKRYLRFVKKAKKEGKTHAEANALWKQEKESKAEPKGTKVASKSKPESKPKTKRESGFVRPKDLMSKLYRQTTRSRVNLKTIKKGLNR